MLSKKYYIVFAKLIGEASDLNDFRERLTEYLADENQRFDWTIFNEAIGKARTEYQTTAQSLHQ